MSDADNEATASITSSQRSPLARIGNIFGIGNKSPSSGTVDLDEVSSISKKRLSVVSGANPAYSLLKKNPLSSKSGGSTRSRSSKETVEVKDGVDYWSQYFLEKETGDEVTEEENSLEVDRMLDEESRKPGWQLFFLTKLTRCFCRR
jgi:hypothetical protein